MKTIETFFEPRNPEHLKEYIYLSKYGHWREGFIPDDVEIGNMSIINIVGIIANSLTEFVLEQNLLNT